jgi:TusE/DsrC/DsvC family sulfur relay protein
MVTQDALDFNGTRIDLCEGGYLCRFEEWSEEAAQELARREGMPALTEEKLAALRFIRDHYARYAFFPILSAVCRNLHRQKDCLREDFFDPLLAWKLAGLPTPEEPVISLLSAGQSPG